MRHRREQMQQDDARGAFEAVSAAGGAFGMRLGQVTRCSRRWLRRSSVAPTLALLCALPLGVAWAQGRTSQGRCATAPLVFGDPLQLGYDRDLGADFDALLEDALRRRQMSGAVLAVMRNGRLLYRRAVGAARLDTLFDLASLTKVVVTVPLVFQLVESGRLDLDQPLSRYLPRLMSGAKGALTVRQLLLHVSGLHSTVWGGPKRPRPVQLSDERGTILRRIRESRLRSVPGSRYRYSDIGFVVLGELVQRLLKKPLAQLAQERLFRPLGMCDSRFAPGPALHSRLLSHWPRHEGPSLGVAYDPLSSRMGGVAGHSGLYATIDDLLRYGRMLVNGGRVRVGKLGTRRLLQASSLAAMSQAQHVPGGAWRTLGWRADRWGAQGSPTLSLRAFGHTGFTGTALWLDPSRKLVVALLSNRTHVVPMGKVGELNRRVHQLLRSAATFKPRRVPRAGLDVLVAEGFASLRGRRIGLITNQTAVDRRGRWIVDLLLGAKDLQLVSIFAPEHGLRARFDRALRDGNLRRRGRSLKVYSLYGKRQRPDAASLAGLDTLVFDIQTVGSRYYTYLATLGWAMEEAARHHLEVVVLDRPNPLGGLQVQGPVSLPRPHTLTNYHPLPVRHGLTIGELARLFRAERKIPVRLRVVQVRGWRRSMPFSRWGWRWINPSPNLRGWRQALAYTGVGLLESTPLAVGRGTASPFLLVGAPFMDGVALVASLRRERLPGVAFVPTSFVPKASHYRDQRCGGVRLLILDPARFDGPRVAVALGLALGRLYPRVWDMRKLDRMFRHLPTSLALQRGRPSAEIVRGWQPALRRFARLRRRYLLY